MLPLFFRRCLARMLAVFATIAIKNVSDINKIFAFILWILTASEIRDINRVLKSFDIFELYRICPSELSEENIIETRHLLFQKVLEYIAENVSSVECWVPKDELFKQANK